MLATLLLATLAVAGPPISLRLSNDGRYMPGDAVRASVQSASDGYLLVLHADPDGRIRVLFPLDPTDDAFVRGGRTYELRTRGDRRDLFLVEWSKGNGTILAAIAREPLQTGEFSVNGHWDYRTLQLDQSLDDESALRQLALRMAPGGVDYDVAPYVIGESVVNGYALSDGGGSSSVVYVGVGYPSYGYWGASWYDPWWGYPCCGWGVSIGWGWGGGYYPYYPWYGYGYGWGYPGYYPGYPVYPGYPGYGHGGYPGYPGYGYGAYPHRTWGGQPHPGYGGGVGVQSQYHFNQNLASNTGTPGYRSRGGASAGNIGVQSSFTRPSGTYNGRRGDGMVASNASNVGATGNTGRRADVGRAAAAAPRDVSRGYNGANAPQNMTYDRGARRRDGAPAGQNLPRDSRVDVNGTYARPSTESYGRRSYGTGTTGGYERTRPSGTYDRGGSNFAPRGSSSYVPRSGSAGGYGGRTYSAPRAPSGGAALPCGGVG